MNINVPRMQCKYIHVANGNPNRLLPPHASICMLDASDNTAKVISKRLQTLNVETLFITMYCICEYILFLPRFDNRNDNDINKTD